MKKLIARFIREDAGQDLIEYALLAGIIITLSAVTITQVGDRVLVLYTTLLTAIGGQRLDTVMLLGAVMRLAVDDAGQDLVEYALLSGIIGVTGVLLFPLITDGMRLAYNGWVTGVSDAWVPCEPGGCP